MSLGKGSVKRIWVTKEKHKREINNTYTFKVLNAASKNALRFN